MIQEFYAKLKHNERVLLFVTLGCVLLATMDRMVLGPILSEMKVMDAEIEAKKETIKRNKRILSFKDGIVEEYSNYMEYLDTGEKSEEEIIAALLQKIETLAKQQTVNISNIRPGDVVENPVFKEYKTSIDCDGTLSNMLSFMNLLEESDYLFQITKYSMTPKSKGSDVVKCTMDIARILITAEKIEGVVPASRKGPIQLPLGADGNVDISGATQEESEPVLASSDPNSVPLENIMPKNQSETVKK